MEQWGIWKTIKIGFFLGIGFIIPQLFVMYSGTVLTLMAMPYMMEQTFDDMEEMSEDLDISDIENQFDKTDQIVLEGFREERNGNRLLILGSIRNEGDDPVSSIQIEAELSDANGNFVYECSSYISKTVKPDESENFQIKCGCGKDPTPEYSSVNVRVVSAHSY